MQGLICLWSGTILNIPAGWHLCDGTQGTPDLRDRFVMGAGTTYDPDDTGGAASHSHTLTADQHGHDIAGSGYVQAGTFFASQVSLETVTGSTNSVSNLPPYFALAYIMKL